MNKPIRCAIAGLGRIGSTLEKDPLREKPASHAGAISLHPDAVLSAGADPDEENRMKFSEDWDGVPTFADSEDMILNIKPEILHIASWTETHPDLLLTALRHKVPVIVCEKPLANSIKEAQTVLDTAKGSTSLIVINHERRFSRDYQSVRDIVINKSLGGLLSITARLYMGRKRPVEKVIYHDGTHMLDILRFLTGGDLIINSVAGDAHRKGGGLQILASSGSTNILIEMSGGRDHLVFELDLSFSSGRIRIGNGTYEVWKAAESPYYSGFRSLLPEVSGWTGDTGYFAGMMDHAVKLALNPTLKNESSLDDGFAVLQLIKNILTAAGVRD